MSRPTKREIERGIERLEDATSPEAPTDVAVEWDEAHPTGRPDGIRYDPSSETLTYDVWAAQQACLDALDAGNDIVAFLGGYGAGKSIIGARWLIAQALAHPGSRFLAIGVDFTKARDTTFRVLFSQLPGEQTDRVTSSFSGPETSPIVADYNKSEHRLTLINGSEILLGSADSWSRTAGAEFGAIWLDEPSHYASNLHKLLEMLGGRLRGVDGPKVMCWTLTGNGYNEAWEILEQRQDIAGDPIGLSIEVIRASTLDNPYLDEGDKARFERQYGGTTREDQALHGGFGAATGLVYDGFTRADHVIPHAQAESLVVDDWRVYGYDAGWSAPRVVLEVGKTGYDQLVVLDEYYERKSHIDDAIAWLEGRPSGTIYADHFPDHIDQLRRAGLTAEPAMKDLDTGIAEVRRRLEFDGARPIAEPLSATWGSTAGTETESEVELVDGRVGLLVSDRCEHLIREFHSYKEEDVGTTGAMDHCLDTLRYASVGAAGNGRPVRSATW
ncbi:terminase large subunit domain-containing protein [Halorarius litoreus]|uniref:terminase large subunit domain-containing protein n=1 Tax=Halorarius litoreus TaxID=2962676 RepID=UPI0020CE7860|nr:terminase family protein [Halorarius litoreus]